MARRIAENLARVREAVDRTAYDVGRRPQEIQLLAVSKTFGPEAVEAAADAGQIRFGENRVQEAAAKRPRVARPGLEWHLIGHLQSNKTRRAVELFDVVETVDSVRLVSRLAEAARDVGRVLPVLLEVNLAGEAQKGGVAPDQLESLAEAVESETALALVGLMAIPPWYDDPEASRPYFHQLARLRDRLNQGRSQPLEHLSMGMSHDFAVAIQEGATIVRVGTAIFGERMWR